MKSVLEGSWDLWGVERAGRLLRVYCENTPTLLCKPPPPGRFQERLRYCAHYMYMYSVQVSYVQRT